MSDQQVQETTDENFDDDGSVPFDDGESDAAEPVKSGYYSGCKALANSGTDWGETEAGDPQTIVNVWVPKLDREFPVYLVFGDSKEGKRASRDISIEKLKACGWDGSEEMPFRGIDKNEITVRISYDTYRGKTSLRADIVTGGRFKHEMPVEKRNAFAAELSKHAAALASGTASSAPSSAPSGTSRPAQRQAPAQGGYSKEWDKGGNSKAPTGGKVQL
jgi:hypothetical protein